MRHIWILPVLLCSGSPVLGQVSFQGLGDLPGGINNCDAVVVSRDGSTVGGYSYSAAGQEAFRWTRQTGMVGLGDLSGSPPGSYVEGCSGDGSVMVGWVGDGSSPGTQAFLWTAQSGMIGMGYLPGGSAYSLVLSKSPLTVR